MAKRKKTNWALLEPTDHLMRYIFGGRAGVGGWTKEQVEKQIKLERIEIKKHQKGSPLWAAYFKELQSFARPTDLDQGTRKRWTQLPLRLRCGNIKQTSVLFLIIFVFSNER